VAAEAGGPHSRQVLHFECTTTSVVALDVVAVRDGAAASEGATILEMRQLMASLRQDGVNKLELVAPLEIPMELAWLNDDEITA